LGLFLLEILLYDREREKRENMEIQIMDYTRDKIPDMLDFERRLREEENFWGWGINEAYVKAVEEQGGRYPGGPDGGQ